MALLTSPVERFFPKAAAHYNGAATFNIDIKFQTPILMNPGDGTEHHERSSCGRMFTLHWIDEDGAVGVVEEGTGMIPDPIWLINCSTDKDGNAVKERYDFKEFRNYRLKSDGKYDFGEPSLVLLTCEVAVLVPLKREDRLVIDSDEEEELRPLTC